MSAQGTHAVVGLTGVTTEVDGLRLSSDRVIRFELPDRITPEHIDLMQKDFEVISQLVRDNRETVLNLQNAVLRNDFPTAERLAKDCGLTEENLVRCGGGQVGLAFGILAVLVVAAVVLGSHDSGPPPVIAPEGGPPDTDGGPDAGPG